MNIMTYKGYQASITFEAEDNVFVGRLAGINDRILFEGESVHELKQHLKMPLMIILQPVLNVERYHKNPIVAK